MRVLVQDHRSLLAYWRSSLADGMLPRLPKEATKRDVTPSWLAEGRLEEDLTGALFKDWEREQKRMPGGRGGEDMPVVPVLIAPLVFIAQHADGSAKRDQEVPYCPIIVPASLHKSGALTFDPGKLPWVARAALEPTGAQEPPLGSLEDFDKFRSTTRPPEGEWQAYVSYVEEMCRAVAGVGLAEVSIAAYDRAAPLVVAAQPPISPARHLIKLADHVLDRCDSPPGALAGLIGEPDGRPLLDGGWPAHLGQMSGAYPLADLQREALRHTLACRTGDVLAVNGPPGTGKTTLLQSIVASLYVAAALDDAEPPVIFATSTNNQAVTNVIDSFGAAEIPAHRAEDPMNGRWLPGVRSYGVFLPASGKKVDAKYQVAQFPNYGRALSGLHSDLLEPGTFAEIRAAFLNHAAQALGRPFEAVEEVRAALHERIRELARRLGSVVDLSAEVARFRSAYAGTTAAEIIAAIERDTGAATRAAAERQQEIERLARQARAADEALERFEAAASRAAKSLVPRGLVDLILGLLPSVKATRWDDCRRIMAEVGETDGLFAQLQVPPFEAVRQHLAARIETVRKASRPLREAAAAAARSAETEAKRVQTELDARRKAIAAWSAAESRWATQAEELAELGARALLMDAHRLVEDPAAAERVLDITWRHDLFLLATHYWEARWLASVDEMAAGKEDPLRTLSRKKRDDAVFRLRHMAQLTPCFVSTAFMLPDHLQCFDPAASEGAKNPPLFDAVDLLIVDEAGQVSPEIGALPLALAKRGLVVGDVHQIEPVWSIGPEIDHGNLAQHGLQENETALDSAGALARNGSLMQMARRASAFSRADEEGMFLEEHRRCQAPMVAVCNDLVYRGRLKACAKPLENPLLPVLGWANVRSASIPRGSSRINPGEADAIAEWLARRRGEIETHYGKSLEQIVGVVTPFGAQKGELRAALNRHGVGGEMTVGTVHALQGAEREIVLFSPTHTAENGADPFFDRGPNMLNVAVSRAKHSFLVFGDMRVFNPARGSPSGKLARHLFGPEGAEIADVLSRPEFLSPGRPEDTIRVETLQEHRDLLRAAFEHAAVRLLVVSPYLRAPAVRGDRLDELVRAAVGRGVSVALVYDPDQNADGKQPLPATAEAIRLLAEAGAELRPVRRIHNKTLAVDDAWIAEGSFNWLSAARDETARYARTERSLRYGGPRARDYIEREWADVALKDGVT